MCESKAEAWASPSKKSGESQAMVYSSMQEVYEDMVKGSSSLSRPGGSSRFPKRLSEMISKELNATDATRGHVMVELTELLFMRCRDQVFRQHGLENLIEGIDSPEYKHNQQVSLQRCMYLYSQVLYANAEWGLSNREDKICFETLYAFLSRVVQLAIQQTLETIRGAAKVSCQASVEEELGRLFRSAGFNTFNIQRARTKEAMRAEAQEGSKTQGEQDSLDALLKQKAKQDQQASEACTKHSLQMQRRRDLREAACARSPMLAAVLPSARDKVQAVYQKSTAARLRCNSHRTRKAPDVDLVLTSARASVQNTWAFCKERAPHLSYQHSA